MKYTFSLFVASLLTLSATAQTPVWRINTVAGNGIQAYAGDGMTATNASLSGPYAVAFDTLGNYYIADYFNYRVRKVTAATGVINSIAGNGIFGNSGDNSIGTSAQVIPHSVAADRKGNVFIADATASVIRKVNSVGIISRYAGTAVYGYSGDGGAALGANLASPHGLAVNTAGDLFIADAGNHTVRKIAAATGIITTVAGNDTAGYSGDFDLAIHAELDSPVAVAVDLSGNVFISDHRNNVIRKVDGTTGIISTYAGTGTYNYSGDGAAAVLADINGPQGLVTDTVGNLYFCDANNNVVRKVTTAGIISTVVGNGSRGFGGDLSLATSANMNNPFAIAIDKQNNLLIADANNQRIRKVYNATLGVSTVTAATISLYPNPFTNNITISGLTAADMITVYDVAGRLVLSLKATNGSQVIAMPATLTAGTYTLQVAAADGSKKTTAQLVKE